MSHAARHRRTPDVVPTRRVGRPLPAHRIADLAPALPACFTRPILPSRASTRPRRLPPHGDRAASPRD